MMKELALSRRDGARLQRVPPRVRALPGAGRDARGPPRRPSRPWDRGPLLGRRHGAHGLRSRGRGAAGPPRRAPPARHRRGAHVPGGGRGRLPPRPRRGARPRERLRDRGDRPRLGDRAAARHGRHGPVRLARGSRRVGASGPRRRVRLARGEADAAPGRGRRGRGGGGAGGGRQPRDTLVRAPDGELHAAGLRRLHLRLLVLPVPRGREEVRSSEGRPLREPAVAPFDRLDPARRRRLGRARRAARARVGAAHRPDGGPHRRGCVPLVSAPGRRTRASRPFASRSPPRSFSPWRARSGPR